MINLLDAIGKGFNGAMVERLPQGLAEFWRHRDSLHVVDGVVMMGSGLSSCRHSITRSWTTFTGPTRTCHK